MLCPISLLNITTVCCNVRYLFSIFEISRMLGPLLPFQIHRLIVLRSLIKEYSNFFFLPVVFSKYLNMNKFTEDLYSIYNFSITKKRHFLAIIIIKPITYTLYIILSFLTVILAILITIFSAFCRLYLAGINP